jgi:hypothetical protein
MRSREKAAALGIAVFVPATLGKPRVAGVPHDLQPSVVREGDELPQFQARRLRAGFAASPEQAFRELLVAPMSRLARDGASATTRSLAGMDHELDGALLAPSVVIAVPLFEITLLPGIDTGIDIAALASFQQAPNDS